MQYSSACLDWRKYSLKTTLSTSFSGSARLLEHSEVTMRPELRDSDMAYLVLSRRILEDMQKDGGTN